MIPVSRGGTWVRRVLVGQGGVAPILWTRFGPCPRIGPGPLGGRLAGDGRRLHSRTKTRPGWFPKPAGLTKITDRREHGAARWNSTSTVSVTTPEGRRRKTYWTGRRSTGPGWSLRRYRSFWKSFGPAG